MSKWRKDCTVSITAFVGSLPIEMSLLREILLSLSLSSPWGLCFWHPRQEKDNLANPDVWGLVLHAFKSKALFLLKLSNFVLEHTPHGFHSIAAKFSSFFQLYHQPEYHFLTDFLSCGLPQTHFLFTVYWSTLLVWNEVWTLHCLLPFCVMCISKTTFPEPESDIWRPLFVESFLQSQRSETFTYSTDYCCYCWILVGWIVERSSNLWEGFPIFLYWAHPSQNALYLSEMQVGGWLSLGQKQELLWIFSPLTVAELLCLPEKHNLCGLIESPECP